MIQGRGKGSACSVMCVAQKPGQNISKETESEPEKEQIACAADHDKYLHLDLGCSSTKERYAIDDQPCSPS